MTRTQALTLGVLAGFVILVFTAMLLLLVVTPTLPILPPTSTPVLPTPLPTPTPTLPNFMPTSGPTPTLGEPTPPNTRVPTVTPGPTNTPAPTIVINLPTRRPTATPTVPTATPAPPTSTSVPPTSTFAPRRFRVSFEADETELIRGECTNLRWEVEGAISILLDDREVEPEGKKEVCPDENTEYKLEVRFPDQARVEHETVEIIVTDESSGDNDNNDNEDNN